MHHVVRAFFSNRLPTFAVRHSSVTELSAAFVLAPTPFIKHGLSHNNLAFDTGAALCKLARLATSAVNSSVFSRSLGHACAMELHKQQQRAAQNPKTAKKTKIWMFSTSAPNRPRKRTTSTTSTRKPPEPNRLTGTGKLGTPQVREPT